MNRTIAIGMVFWVLHIGSTHAQEKTGLLIVAHGAPVPQWNAAVLDLENEMKDLFVESGGSFVVIRVALMEFSEPSINTVIRDFEDMGITRAYVIPLFIAPSGHTIYDVPTILGLYAEKEMIQTIKEEGTTIVNTDIRLTVGPTLNVGDVLKEVMLDRVRELSTEPDSESVVLLAHGDYQFEPVWDSVCRDIGSYICAETGVEYFDFAFVEIGQAFISEGVPAILRVADKNEKTIVVGLYVATSVDDMARNSMMGLGGMRLKGIEMLTGKNVHLAGRGLLPHPKISRWIADRAVEWIGGLD